jgi:hypothetical protein
MHEFDSRLHQLLDTLPGITAARRQRLLRSLRQDDAELGFDVEEPELEAAMKAAYRVAAHELLDVFCLHLEGALGRCADAPTQALVMALTSMAMAQHACVLFDEAGHAAGISYPSQEAFVVGITVDKLTVVGRGAASHDAGAARATRCDVFVRAETRPAETASSADATTALHFTFAEIAANPYQSAAEIIQRLRAAE